MEYFIYCRDKPGTLELRRQLVEAHWSFMDRYAEGMVARGPTLAEDGDTPTGSVHIVDLPDAEAARVFAYEEPNHRAGVYAEIMVRRWRNALGRRMWAFKGDPDANPRFLVIAHGRPGASAVADSLAEAHRAFMAEHDRRNRLIVGGPLLSDDGSARVGTALMVEQPSRPAAEAMLAADPYATAGIYERVEIHRWRFGGRPDGIHVL
ncbi:YciI family protein [Inquilinus sp. NPDC058860]|uniref:YciI family protein n=1 Tax=Inquilinus sp. NPDC058860 TaxID=3346652 RepID=UPI0036D07378